MIQRDKQKVEGFKKGSYWFEKLWIELAVKSSNRKEQLGSDICSEIFEPGSVLGTKLDIFFFFFLFFKYS